MALPGCAGRPETFDFTGPTLETMDAEMVSWAIRKSAGKIAGAAALLGINRTTLQRHLARRRQTLAG